MFDNIFDAKVINHECKTDVQCRVLTKGRSARDRIITKICEMRSEAVIGNADGLFETRHYLSDLDVDPTGRASKAIKVVLVDKNWVKGFQG